MTLTAVRWMVCMLLAALGLTAAGLAVTMIRQERCVQAVMSAKTARGVSTWEATVRCNELQP